MTQICQDVIQSQYVLGVQRVQHYSNGLEFKLLGNPWSCGIDGHDGIHGRNLICHLFAALAGLHWRPVISADVSARHPGTGEDNPLFADLNPDVDSIFFTYDPPAVPESEPANVQPLPYGVIN